MGWQIPLAVWLGVAATLAGVFGVIFRDDKEAARDAVVAAIFWPALAVCAVAVAPLYILGPLASWLIMAVVYVSGFVTGAWAALIRKGDTDALSTPTQKDTKDGNYILDSRNRLG